MDRSTFLQSKFPRNHLTQLLDSPKLAEDVYKYLEYVNGGSLPSSGVLAGQAVSTAIDYQLGLRDATSLDIKDIDHFKETSQEQIPLTRVWKNHIIYKLAEYLECLAYSRDDIYSWSPEQTRWVDEMTHSRHYPCPLGEEYRAKAEFFRACIQYAPEDWSRLYNALPMRARWPHIVINALRPKIYALTVHPDPRIQAAYQQVTKLFYDNHVRSEESKSIKSTLDIMFPVVLPIITGQESTKEGTMWESEKLDEDYGKLTLLRYNEVLLKGSFMSKYGIMGVLPNEQAVQPVLTSEVYLYSNHEDPNSEVARGTTYQNMTVTSHNAIPLDSNSMGYALGVVAGFDINSVQVGLDLKSMKIVYTHRYLEFLMSRELLITNTQTPMLSMIRALSKAQQHPVYCNQARMARLGQLVMAQRLLLLQPEDSTEHIVSKLQAVYDEVRSHPQLIKSKHLGTFSPVIISKTNAEQAARIPLLDEMYTMEELTGKQGSSSGYLLVPKYAEAGHTLLCGRIQPDSVSEQNAVPLRNYPPTNKDVMQLAVQHPEMNARWARRAECVIQWLGLPLEKYRMTEMKALLANISARKVPATVAEWLDTEAYQSTVAHIIQHGEFNDLQLNTNTIKVMHQSLAQIHSHIKPIRQWARRRIVELQEQKHRDSEVQIRQLRQLDSLPLQFSISLYTGMHLRGVPLTNVSDQLSSKIDAFFTELFDLRRLTRYGYAPSSNGGFNGKPEWYRREWDHYISTQSEDTQIECKLAFQLWDTILWNDTGYERTGRTWSFSMIDRLLDEMQSTQVNYNRTRTAEHKDESEVAADFRLLNVLSRTLTLLLNCAVDHVRYAINGKLTSLKAQWPTLMDSLDIKHYLRNIENLKIPHMPETLDVPTAKDWLEQLRQNCVSSAAMLYFIDSFASAFEDQIAPVNPLQLDFAIDQAIEDACKEDQHLSNASIEVKELLTKNELTFEGERMRHCVGGYFSSVSENTCRILTLAITLGGHVYRGTTEWRKSSYDDFKIYSNQFKGPSNKAVHPSLAVLHRHLLRVINGQPRKVWH